MLLRCARAFPLFMLLLTACSSQAANPRGTLPPPDVLVYDIYLLRFAE